MTRRAFFLAPVAAALVALDGCATTAGPKSVIATADSAPGFSILAKLIGDAGLTDTLSDPGPFTVFAPTNEAFAKVQAKTLAELAANKKQLRAVMTYHVAPGSVSAADVKPGNVKTVQGANLAVAKAGAFATVENAVVTKADVKATTGVIHAIDTVLIPPTPRR